MRHVCDSRRARGVFEGFARTGREDAVEPAAAAVRARARPRLALAEFGGGNETFSGTENILLTFQKKNRDVSPKIHPASFMRAIPGPRGRVVARARGGGVSRQEKATRGRLRRRGLRRLREQTPRRVSETHCLESPKISLSTRQVSRRDEKRAQARFQKKRILSVKSGPLRARPDAHFQALAELARRGVTVDELTLRRARAKGLFGKAPRRKESLSVDAAFEGRRRHKAVACAQLSYVCAVLGGILGGAPEFSVTPLSE